MVCLLGCILVNLGFVGLSGRRYDVVIGYEWLGYFVMAVWWLEGEFSG